MGLGWSFRRFWAATGLSNIADGTYLVALSITALGLTRSPFQIAALDMVAGLPWLLFGLVAGAIADRVDKRRLMIGVQVARGAVLLVLALALANDVRQLWLLYVAALALGVAETLFDTCAQTVLPKIVASDQLERANSRLSGVELVGNYFIGPPLGGVITGVATAAAFATGSALYLLAAVAVLTVRGSFRVVREGPATSIRADIAEGLRYLRDQPLLRRLGLLTAGRLVTFSAVTGVLAVYAVAPGPMGLSPSGYGLFLSAMAIGAVTSSIVGERVIARIGAARCLRITMLAFAVTELAPLAVNPFAVGALWSVGTFFVIIWAVITLTVRQRLVPEQLLGRVNSAFRVVSWGMMPVGALIGGVMAEVLGFRWTFVICGAVTAALTLGTLRITEEALSTGLLRPKTPADVPA